VYIADQGSGEVVMVTPSGTLSTVVGTGIQGNPTPGPAANSQLAAPQGLALDAGGDLYIADNGANEVLKVTPLGTLSVVAGTGAPGAPVPGPATSSPVNSPDGVAVDASGNLYIASDDSYVAKVTPSGTLSIFAGNRSYGNPTPGPATSSPLGEPSELGIDAAGNLYIADGIDIEQVTPDGTLSIIAGNNTVGVPTYGGPATSSALQYPSGVASTLAGHVYIADTFNNTVDQIAPDAPVNTTVPTTAGTATSGQTLTAGQGAWTNDPEIYTYQWEDCGSTGANCTTISGATASSYALSASDVGHTVRVVVTAQNGGGSTTSTSAASALVQAAPTTPTTTPPPKTTTAPPTTKPNAGTCPSPSGTLSAAALGPFSLGMTRSAARSQLPHYDVIAYGFDNFCLRGGPGIRVAYPSARLLQPLTSGEQRAIKNRIVIALTANPRYTLDAIRPGTALRTAKTELKLEAGIRIGLNTWYVAVGKHNTWVLKVRNATVQEIGTANKALTSTRAQQRTLLTSF
jgi:hypothetical protein